MKDTYSEAWRMECEARYVASHPDPTSYLAKVEEKRGKEAAEKLRQAARKIYRERSGK